MLKPESVWDYPRPPGLEPVAETLRVVFEGREVARTSASFRVLETSHPPVYYFPRGDVDASMLRRAAGESFCEWKGMATYFDVLGDGMVLGREAWSYEEPTAGFAAIAGYVAFYARTLECWVGDERVTPQPGGFYGGWVTGNLEGPFKGGPGSRGW